MKDHFVVWKDYKAIAEIGSLQDLKELSDEVLDSITEIQVIYDGCSAGTLDVSYVIKITKTAKEIETIKNT